MFSLIKILEELKMRKVKKQLDALDINANIATAFGIMLIASILVYVVFLKK